MCEWQRGCVSGNERVCDWERECVSGERQSL